MKIAIIVICFAFFGTVSAEPVKCIVNGKTIYTDDPKSCGNSTIRKIEGNVSTFPKVTASKATSANKPLMSSPETLMRDLPSSDSILEQFGMSQEDIAKGWKTIIDAKQRGSWNSLDIPDDVR
jgi:hypothetical protein